MRSLSPQPFFACILVLAANTAAYSEDEDILKWGIPDSGFILKREGYVISYNGWKRSADWSAEYLTKERLEGDAKRRDPFKYDPDVPAEFRATKKDYYKSGYQRGHLAPSADHKRSQAENDGTFLLSNIAPQNGPMNMGFWQRLETQLRNLACTDGVDGVWTFTGTLFMPDKAPPQGKRRRHLTVTYKTSGQITFLCQPTFTRRCWCSETATRNSQLSSCPTPRFRRTHLFSASVSQPITSNIGPGSTSGTHLRTKKRPQNRKSDCPGRMIETLILVEWCVFGRPDRLVALVFKVALSPAEVVCDLRKVLSTQVICDVLVDGARWNRPAGASEEDE